MNKFKNKRLILTVFRLTNYCVLFGLLICGIFTLFYVWIKYPSLANLTLNDILSLNFANRHVIINLIKFAFQIMRSLIMMYIVMFIQTFIGVTPFYLLFNIKSNREVEK